MGVAETGGLTALAHPRLKTADPEKIDTHSSLSKVLWRLKGFRQTRPRNRSICYSTNQIQSENVGGKSRIYAIGSR